MAGPQGRSGRGPLRTVDVIGASGVGYDPGMDPATIAAYEEMFGNITGTGSIIDPSQLVYDPIELGLAGLGATEIDGQILPSNLPSVEAIRAANPIVPVSVTHPASYNPYTEAGFSTGAENLSEAERLGMHWSPQETDSGSPIDMIAGPPALGQTVDYVAKPVKEFVETNTGSDGQIPMDVPVSPLFPYTLRQLLDADILSVQDLAIMQREALATARTDYSDFLNEILYGTEDAPGFLAATGGAMDRFRSGMAERQEAFQTRRTELFDELAASGIDPSLIAEDLAAGDDTAAAVAAIEGGYLDALDLIGGLSEAAMQREGEGRFDAAERRIGLGEAAALAGIEQAGRTAEMVAPFMEIDPAFFYSGAQAGLPVVQLAETRRGERRADAAKAEAEAKEQGIYNALSQFMGAEGVSMPPELIEAMGATGMLPDWAELFPSFEEPEPTWIYDAAGVPVGHGDPAVWQDYREGEARLGETSIFDQLYQTFGDNASAVFDQAMEQVRLSGRTLSIEEALQNALAAENAWAAAIYGG
jgi:hypothetical protein